MSYKLPIDIPEQFTAVELLEAQIKAYERAINGHHSQSDPQVKSWKRQVEIWRQVLKREQDREAMFWSA